MILDFKDKFDNFRLQSSFHRRNFCKKGFLMRQCSLWGFSWERKFQGEYSGGIFQEEVSLNLSNHPIKLKINQRSWNKFNVVSTNHSTKYKSFSVVQIIQHSTNHSIYHIIVYKSFNVVKVHSHCNYKSFNAVHIIQFVIRVGFLNIKLNWKTI